MHHHGGRDPATASESPSNTKTTLTIMRQIICSVIFCLPLVCAYGQSSTPKDISEINPPAVALAPLRFLASDELMGRGTTRPEINIAARYISEAFRSFGLKEVTGINDYFQAFEIKFRKPAVAGSFMIAGNSFEMKRSLIALKGGDITITAPVIYAKHATESDLKDIDVKGKIVITDLGETDSTHARQSLNFLFEKKQAMLQRKGAVAVIERYRATDMSWDALQQSNAREARLQQEILIPVLLVNDSSGTLKNIQGNIEGTLTITGTQIRIVPAKNVMGRVEGTDPKLKNEYIVLSSHYDHLGVAQQPKMEEGKLDSIYNGARDNAIGSTAVIDAARYFAQHPPKRSILFITYTAEEMGLVGSKYFAEHPPMELKQLVYDLNIDNASYNDTGSITLVGLGRTSADEDIKRACAVYGLSILPDPTSGRLFNGSDNLPLAEKGIPAPTFSLGMKSFDESILKRYHQLSDEVGNFDLSYAMKFINAFILSAKYIADDPKQLQWKKGDQYEAAWESLHQADLKTKKE